MEKTKKTFDKNDLQNLVSFPDYKKIRIAFRNYILGKSQYEKGYLKVLKAMEIAEKYHRKTRKDGQAEVSHQYVICSYLMSIEATLDNPIACYIVALLHDTYEDYQYEIVDGILTAEEEIKKELPEYFNMIVCISKIRNGEKIKYEQYFDEISNCPVCSIVKLADRVHNISTMVEPFSEEKQIEYLQDLLDWFLPMAKKAKRNFPSQTAAYENFKFILNTFKNLLAISKLKER